jgi:hypothetical protein
MINAVSSPVPISNIKRSFMDTLWFLSGTLDGGLHRADGTLEEVIDGATQ